MSRKIEADSICEYSDCEKKATDIVYSRNSMEVLLCCELHADIAQDEGAPEYWYACKNCGCRSPIN